MEPFTFSTTTNRLDSHPARRCTQIGHNELIFQILEYAIIKLNAAPFKDAC